MFDWRKVFLLWRVPELRKKVLIVVGLLVVFRVASVIPVPGIPTQSLHNLFAGNQLFGLLDIFSGGGLSNLSIVMLGVGPYITASIVIQLMTMIIPSLENMAKEEGEAGRQKLNQWTRMIAVPLAAVQGFAFLGLIQRQGLAQAGVTFTPAQTLLVLITIVAGTMFLMWLGELISEQGIGNGISLLIFAGIISRLPSDLFRTLRTLTPDQLQSYVAFAVVSVLVIAGVVFITEGQRSVPVSYAKRVRGNRIFGGVASHLPLRVNQAGVIPIIFALSIMLFPGVIANFFVNSHTVLVATSARNIVNLFQNQVFYAFAYFVMVVVFTYFYTSVTFDPYQIAENVQKQGGFIPGIRPGKQTAQFLKFVLNRITLAGALFLGLIAILPLIVQSATGLSTLSIGGTALLIVVSVVLETMKQVESQLTMREYEGF
jgi:preprotein translocase subunit SecY